jgi:hypothetical protein
MQRRGRNLMISKINGGRMKLIVNTESYEEFDCKSGEVYIMEPRRDNGGWRD